MRCEKVEELAGAYILCALSPEETAEIAHHLATCEKHPEVADLAAIGERLPMLAPEMEPPAELKTRLMDAVHRDLATEQRAASATRSAPERLRRLFAPPSLGFGVAATLAVVVAVLLIFNLTTGGGGDTLVRDFQTGQVAGRVIYLPDQETAVLTVDGLEPAPAGKTYQVWAIAGDQPASIGFLSVPDEGTASSEMNVELAEGQTVAVTLEPEGGSTQPTSAPLFAVKI